MFYGATEIRIFLVQFMKIKFYILFKFNIIQKFNIVIQSKKFLFSVKPFIIK